jgi:hypothetical protein
MATLLRFGPQDLLRCRFALSPLWETLAATRTLIEPQRQVHHLPWLRQVQPELAPSTSRRCSPCSPAAATRPTSCPHRHRARSPTSPTSWTRSAPLRSTRSPASLTAACASAGLLSASRIRHQVLYERTPLGIALASIHTS